MRMNRRELLQMGAAGSAVLAAGRAASEPRAGAGGTRMRLGLVSYNVARDWDLETLLKQCRAAGLTAVEFRTTHAHGVEPSLTAGLRARVRQLCADAGILQTSLGTVCEFHSPDPAVVRRNVETCREFVLLARDIGARGVKVRPNGLPAEVPPEKTIAQIGSALKECGQFAADHGVEIWVEVHGSGTAQPACMRAILDSCGHPSVGITWNSNPTDVENGSVRRAFELLGPFIRCCHVNELWSGYPYRELFGLLDASGYDRFALCEVGTPIRAEDGTPFLRCYHELFRELAGTPAEPPPAAVAAPAPQVRRAPGARMRLSLAAYSFRDYLTGKSEPRMDLPEFIDRVAAMDLDGVELTSYYFPDPVTPEHLAGLKLRCHLQGLDITGTPVRNTFTFPAGPERDREVAHVVRWIGIAADLGSPAIRIFAGDAQKGQTLEEAQRCCADSIRACLPHAARRGVILALENHGGIVAEADSLLKIVREVGSPWCGINLDTGNFHTDDPYGDIARCAPLAVTVQVKTEIQRRGGMKEQADLARIVRILRDSGYRGYVTLEYEAAENPLEAVPRHLKALRGLLSGG